MLAGSASRPNRTTNLKLVDARRLTGPNLLAWRPLVVVELALEAGDTVLSARDAYLSELARMRVAFGWSADVGPTIVREHQGGCVIAYDAPLDLMLVATEMSEWAAMSGPERPPFETKRAEIALLLEREQNPRVLELLSAAKAHDLPFFWDDEAISIGAGVRSITWPKTALPAPAEVKWDGLGTIPIAVITGTNGKTTSSRLLARIAREAGHVVGCTSSDGISIGTKQIESGDWTGPAAARMVLQNRTVDFAVLETARGGILRRGLAIETCDAALITNVSEDHTGGYGIDDLTAMTQVKAIAARAVRPGGTVVLNRKVPMLVALAPSLTANVVFFEDRGSDVVKLASASIPLSEIPITFNGAARYNVENVLGVVALAQALGIDDRAIAAGLRGFQPSDNPRRGEVIERNGLKLLLDFAHNPDGIRAVMKLVASLRDPSGRLFVVAGAAGDRQDHEIEGMCEEIAAAKPHRLFVRELLAYLRGRAVGDVPALFARTLSDVVVVESEVEALKRCFDEAKPGDFIVVLVHLDHDAVHAFLG